MFLFCLSQGAGDEAKYRFWTAALPIEVKVQPIRASSTGVFVTQIRAMMTGLPYAMMAGATTCSLAISAAHRLEDAGGGPAELFVEGPAPEVADRSADGPLACDLTVLDDGFGGLGDWAWQVSGRIRVVSPTPATSNWAAAWPEVVGREMTRLLLTRPLRSLAPPVSHRSR